MADDVSETEFATIAAAAGLKLAPQEIARMREGYLGFRALLARIPRDQGYTAEPALVHLPAGARMSR